MALKKWLVLSSLMLSSLQPSFADEVVLAGYLDTTATGSALKVSLRQAAQDGYTMVIFAFARVSGVQIDYYDTSSKDVMTQKIVEAKANGMKVLVSVGGENNTFNPGALTATQISELAQKIVSFVKNNQLDGIDFDIEVHTEPQLILDLLKNIKSIDPELILTAAPQINNGRLVTTGFYEDYQLAINAGLFNYLFLQEYNTPPQNDVTYISTAYPGIKAQVSPLTKIVVGQPTAAVGAGAISIYHPSSGATLTTEAVTAKMLPELKKIIGDNQFGGIMGWSLNIDYDAADYGDPHHIAGSFAYGLKACVFNNQCESSPPQKPMGN